MNKMSLLALGLAAAAALGMTTPSLAAYHKTGTAHVTSAGPDSGASAYAYAMSLGCTAKTPLSESTYMWLQDRAGAASWPLRPNGWEYGAPCNPRGYR